MLPRLTLLISIPAVPFTVAMPSNLSSLNGIFPIFPIFPTGLPEYQCVSLDSWSRPDINWQEGCPRAWGLAKNTEMYQTSKKFEFLAQGVQPQYSHRREEIRTPRRYNLDGCTVAVVNLASFHPNIIASDIPGQPPTRPRPPSVVTTFNDLWRAGQYVFENCVNIGQYGGRRPVAGWNNAGSTRSIGVFFWATDSVMDRRVAALSNWCMGYPCGEWCWGIPCPPANTNIPS